MIEVDLAHDILGILISLLLWSVFILDKSFGQLFYSDHSISFKIDPVEAPHNGVFIIILDDKIDDKYQNTELNVCYLESAEFSHVLEKIQHALMISWRQRLFQM